MTQSPREGRFANEGIWQYKAKQNEAEQNEAIWQNKPSWQNKPNEADRTDRGGQSGGFSIPPALSANGNSANRESL